MDFRDYTYIMAIAEYRTISKAADALFISQPSLSIFLQNIESKLGTPLFKRVNKQFYPTYAGEQYLEAGRQIIAIQNIMNKAIEKIIVNEAGKLNIAITSVRGYYVLPKVFPEFMKEYPGYKINIIDCGVADVEKHLSSGEADLGIYAVTRTNSEFKNYHIKHEEVILCMSHNNPYKEKAVNKEGRNYPWLDLSLLKDEHFFVNDPNKWRISTVANELLKEAGIHPDISVLGNLETCLSLAASGMGAAFSYDICVPGFRNYKEAPCYYSVGEKKRTAEFVVACRKGYAFSSAENRFVELIRKYFGE